MIGDWSFLEDGTIKADPSLSSICMHVLIDEGMGICKELVLVELVHHQNIKNNQNRYLH